VSHFCNSSLTRSVCLHCKESSHRYRHSLCKFWHLEPACSLTHDDRLANRDASLAETKSVERCHPACVFTFFPTPQASALFACSIKRLINGRKYIDISSGAQSAQAPVQAPAPKSVAAPAPQSVTAPAPAPVTAPTPAAPAALPVTAPRSALSQAQMPAPVTAPALQPSAAPAPVPQLKEQPTPVLTPSKAPAAATKTGTWACACSGSCSAGLGRTRTRTSSSGTTPEARENARALL
jgi:hypothetical protein